MGSVFKCRKRSNARGGSARPDFVRRHQNCCFPIFGALGLQTGHDAFYKNKNRNSIISVRSLTNLIDLTGGSKGSSKVDLTSLGSDRPCSTASIMSEKSKLISYGSRREKFYALKSIHLSRCSSEEYRNELKNEGKVVVCVSYLEQDGKRFEEFFKGLENIIFALNEKKLLLTHPSTAVLAPAQSCQLNIFQ